LTPPPAPAAVIGRFPWDPFPPGTPDPRGPDPLLALAYRSGVTGADAYRSVRLALRRENGVLRIGNRFVADGRYREVAFVAAGHAAGSMTLALLSVLDERVTEGYVAGATLVPDEVPFPGTSIPPGWGGADAAAGVVRAAEEIAERLGESDLLVLLLSPGALRALGTPPPGFTAADFSAFLERAHGLGATGPEVERIARVLATRTPLLPPETRADVETLVVDRGDGAAAVGGGPTIAVRPGERAEARATLERIGLLAGLPASARDRLAPGGTAAPGVPARARRPVVVAAPSDALRSAADVTFEKGWTVRLAALSIPERGEAATDRFLGRVEEIFRSERLGPEVRTKGIAAFATLSLDLPEGTEEGPALAAFLERARDGLKRREMSVGLFRTSGTIGDPRFPGGAVVGAPTEPGADGATAPTRALSMQPGITDVGFLAVAVLPKAAPPARS
jgi:glycerate-2-kinase